jgi:hypothetical protein
MRFLLLVTTTIVLFAYLLGQNFASVNKTSTKKQIATPKPTASQSSPNKSTLLSKSTYAALKATVKKYNFNPQHVFYINMGIPSRKPRFFIVD